MTIDDLAQSIQSDFASLRKDVATKDDIRQIRKEMATKQDLATLREEIQSQFANRSELRTEINAAKKDLIEEIGNARETRALSARVEVAEQKLGIKPGRYSA